MSKSRSRSHVNLLLLDLTGVRFLMGSKRECGSEHLMGVDDVRGSFFTFYEVKLWAATSLFTKSKMGIKAC